LFRKIGASYLDFLFACFLGYVGAVAFQTREDWALYAAILLLLQVFLCRAMLKPTLGDLFMNIRYLTSASNQVVADIRVVNPKVKLNGFLLAAGILETTWAVFGLSAWTLFDQAASFGAVRGGALSFIYYTAFGFLLLLCASSLLSASKASRWAVPGIHALVLSDHLASYGAWQEALKGHAVLWPWADKAVPIATEAVSITLLAFAAFSILLASCIALSRKFLVL